MKLIWRGGTARGSMAQRAFIGIVAAVGGLVAFVPAALGLIAGVALTGVALGAVWFLRRRAGKAACGRHTDAGGRAAEGTCVDLDKDSYTIRVVEEKQAAANSRD